MGTRYIQDYLSSGEATDMFIGGTTADEKVVTFADLDAAVLANFVDVTIASYSHDDEDNKTLGVSYTATGACTITVDSDLIAMSNYKFVVKDTGGNAGTNNITIATEGSETIDGAATLVLNTDYESVSLVSDGSNLFIY